MRSEPRRRAILQAGTAALLSAVAGCSGGEDDSTPDPDEGRDSYGIYAVNETNGEHEIHVTVRQPWEEKTVFEGTAALGPDESKTWHQVITEEKEHAIVAKFDGGNGEPETEVTWVTPGREGSPPDAHIRVQLGTQPDVPDPILSLYFESTVED